MTWILTKLKIDGVKGVLNRSGEFILKPKDNKPRSIAIFGRNGHGKSGYADAVEYFFSVDGEVDHLGKGGADSEQGGKHAIPHVLAAEKGVTPIVSAEFFNIDSKEKLVISRPIVVGRNDIRPSEISQILQKSPAYRILRQHDLRRFVVDMKPGEKFSEFARWIGLEQTALLLKQLTTVENTLKVTDVDREISERLRSISSNTLNEISTYDLPLIYSWIEKELRNHDLIHAISGLDDIDKGLTKLRSLQKSLLIASKAAQQYQTQKSIEQDFRNLLDNEGLFSSTKNLIQIYEKLEKQYQTNKENIKDSIFQEVWESSKELLSSNETEYCPVCLTPWENTNSGSQENAKGILTKNINSLSNLKKIDSEKSIKQQEINQNLNKMHSILLSCEKKLSELQIVDRINEFSELLITLKTSIQASTTSFKNHNAIIDRCSEFVKHYLSLVSKSIIVTDDSVKSHEIEQSITRILSLKEALERLSILVEEQIEIRKVETDFIKIADRIRHETNIVAENAVKLISKDVESIYKNIHPGEAIPKIFIQQDALEKTLTIRVSFHSKERRVPPGGYLSEAQINTIGLAVFLCSVKYFNTDFPFLFLDDIVSSYDADCRARIVDVLAEQMKGFQIFLTTHDERFYTHLKGRLATENWVFERISSYDFESGPKRESDNLGIEQINELISEGDPKLSGNAVRQFMEDWFDNICERYYVRTLHKSGSKDYKRTLFDYWDPLIQKLNSQKDIASKSIMNSEEFTRLNGSLMPIINYYSHNQTNPYEWGSNGDVEYLWEKFLDFANLFKCNSCGKILLCHYEQEKLYCTCGEKIIK